MTRRTGRRVAVIAAVASLVLAAAVFVYASGVRGERRVTKARWARVWGTPGLTRRQADELLGGPGRAAEFRPLPSDPGVVRFVLGGADFRQEFTAAWASDPAREFRVWRGTESYYIVGFEGGAARHCFECPMRDGRAGWLARQLERFDR